MTTLGPRPFALALAGLLAVYALGRCDGRQAADLGWHERNVAKVTAQVRIERKKADAAIAAKDASGRAVTIASGTLDTAQAATDTALTRAEAALADATTDADTLRARLRTLVATTRLQQILTDSLQAALVRDAAAHLAERAAFTATIAAQDAVIAAQKRQIRALDCRILGLRCPSRLQAAGLGGLGVLLVLLL